MEDRAKYVLVGLFTFIVIVGAFGFVYWLHARRQAPQRERLVPRDLLGLGHRPDRGFGAPVLFDGIRVGEVSDLRLHRQDPRRGGGDTGGGVRPYRCAPIPRRGWSFRV